MYFHVSAPENVKALNTPILDQSQYLILMSLSVVEDYSEGVTVSGAQTTHAVTEVHAIDTLLALDRTITNSKHNAIAL